MTRALSTVLLLFIFTPLSAADWPQWGGPNRDGVSPETGLLKSWPKEGPKLVWKANLGGVGYGSPAVVGNNLFVAAAEDDKDGTKELALCLNVKDGSQVWKVELPTAEGKYLTGWGSGPRSTPTVDGEAVYFLSPRGDLIRLKAGDGSKVWAVSLTKDFGGSIPGWGYSESVLIDGDHLICTPGGKNGAILALDKASGKKVWQSKELTDAAAYASIIPADVGGVRQYVTQTAKSAVGVRAKDGKLLWRKADLKRAVAVIPTPVVHEDHAFFTAGYRAGCELFKLTSKGETTSAETIYTKNPVMENHHGGVVRLGNHIYGYSDSSRQWICIAYQDKELSDPVWKSKALGKGAVVAADGCLYCYSESKGECVLAEASPKAWKELGRFVIPEKSQFPRKQGHIWTHPVIANGKLYLRDHEHLFCYDIAAK